MWRINSRENLYSVFQPTAETYSVPRWHFRFFRSTVTNGNWHHGLGSRPVSRRRSIFSEPWLPVTANYNGLLETRDKRPVTGLTLTSLRADHLPRFTRTLHDVFPLRNRINKVHLLRFVVESTSCNNTVMNFLKDVYGRHELQALLAKYDITGICSPRRFRFLARN